MRQVKHNKTRIIPAALALLATLCSSPAPVGAHSVAQVQTTKYFAPDTVSMLTARALSGSPGIQVGDIIDYIIQFTPVRNASDIGVQGYVTDFIPTGTEVVGASIVQKSGSNFVDVPPPLPGLSYDGWGARGQATFNAPFNAASYDSSGLCSAAGKTNNCNARMCELQADTGMFYSTDSRTAVSPALPTRMLQGVTSNGYNIYPDRFSQLTPIIGETVATTHDQWDADQTSAFGTTTAGSKTNFAALAAPKSAAAFLIASNAGNTPFNAGSPVAGPQTGYQLDNTGVVGPWQRIYYSGSRMGDASRGPALATGNAAGAVCGTTTSAGWNLSPSNPLPTSTNAVRWALGKLQVGEIKYVKIRLRITAPVPSGGLINGSEVFGADTANDDVSAISKGDNAWLYHIPSVTDNNANLFVLKEIKCVYSGASCNADSGANIPPNAKVRYRITYLNTGNSIQTSVTLKDKLPCQIGNNAATNLTVTSKPAVGWTTVPTLPAATAGSNCATTSPTRVEFNLYAGETLDPGAGGSLEYDVQTAGAAGNVVVNTATLTSAAIPSGAVSNAPAAVVSTAVLSLAKSVNVSSATPGSNVTYTITVTNTGASAATAIVLRDFLPTSGGAANAATRFSLAATPNFVYTGIAAPTTAAAATPPTIAPYSGNANQNQVTWTWPAATSLAAGASFTISFDATVGASVPASQTAYTNDVRADFNNSASAISNAIISQAPVYVGYPISGTVFEDINYGGGAGRSLSDSGGAGMANAQVELYSSSGAFVSSTTTNLTGAYSFNGLAAADYTVRVANQSLRSTRSGGTACGSSCLPIQTFRTTATSGTASPVTDRVGGEDPAKQDSAINTTSATLASLTAGSQTPQSISSVTVSTSAITGINFGFNYDTIVNTNSNGQGSLAQFITNANALGGDSSLAQAGNRIDHATGSSAALASGVETSIFMITDGNPHAGLRTGLTSQLSSGRALISLTGTLPAISTSMIIDGGTQTANIGNTNAGTIGTGGTVGTDNVTGTTLQAPEVEIYDNGGIAAGLDIQASSAVVRGLALVGFGNSANSDTDAGILVGASANNVVIENNLIGTTALVFGDPGAAARGAGDNIRVIGGDSGIIRKNLIGFSGGNGITLSGASNSWSITGNEIRGNGQSDALRSGIEIANGSTTDVTANLVAANRGAGIDLSGASSLSNTLTNNSISGNGTGLTKTAGIRINSNSNTLNNNILTANIGSGVIVTSTASLNTISRNSTHANGKLGIDLLAAADSETAGTVTLNDTSDADSGGNGLLNFPVIESAIISGTNLTLKGWARPASAIELFTAATDPTSFGEGQTYLMTVTEGTSDLDATASLYGPAAINGIVQGTDNTSRFTFVIPVPPGVAGGTVLTSTATLASATSEFSGVVTVVYASALTKSFTPATMAVGGTSTLTFKIDNSAGFPLQSGLAFTETLPADVTVSGAVTASQCGGTLSSSGSQNLTFSGGSIAAGVDSCTINAVVTSTVIASYLNDSTKISLPSPGLDTSGVNATLTVTAAGTTVSGTVYADTNHNGFIDSGEPSTLLTPYIKLISGSCSGTFSQAVQVTGATGAFSLPSVSAGSYCLLLSTNNNADTTAGTPVGWLGIEGSGGKLTSVTTTPVNGQNFGLFNGSRIDGNVFSDIGTGGGTANDGIRNGSEAGIAGTAVKANNGGTVYDSTTTNGAGDYTLWIPASAGALTVTETNLTSYISTGASVGTAPSGVYDRATDTTAFTPVAGTSYTGINFADVPENRFQTDNTGMALPGTVIFYPHTFTAGSGGSVVFSAASSASPAVSGWSEIFFLDNDCSGTFSAGDTQIVGAAATTVVANQSLCLLLKEFVPANAPIGGTNLATLSATFTFTNAPNPALTRSYARTDTTTVGTPTSSGLKLTKSVDKTSALPGDSLIYTITYSNSGSGPLGNIVIHDSVPAFTINPVACCVNPATACLGTATASFPATITGCVAAISGSSINWTFNPADTLAPGATGQVKFGVTVQP